MKLIDAIYTREKGDIFRWSHYFDAYDFHFGPLQGKPIRLLEIGILNGGSLWMWKRYFNKGIIIGIDYDERCSKWDAADQAVYVYIGDQCDGDFLQTVNHLHGPFDIIIDDGSHKMHDQQYTLTALFSTMADGGIYVIEDLHTSFWPTWDGGGKDSTLNFLKSQVDMLQGWAMRSHEAQDLRKDFVPDELERNVSSMHFYDSICFIYKNGHGKNTLGAEGTCKYDG